MQNHLFYRYFHFNCRKKPWGRGKRKINIFEAGIINSKIVMLNFVTSMPMDSGKFCLGIPWGSLVQSLVLKLGQHQPRSVQSVHSHTPQTHTHTSVSCACTYTPNDNFYLPSLLLVVFKALHRIHTGCCILEIQLLTPAGLGLLSVLSSRLDYTPQGTEWLNHIVQQVKCFGVCVVSLRPIWGSSKTYLNLADCLN